MGGFTARMNPDGTGAEIRLYLITLRALQPGQSAVLDNSITLTVTRALPDGFAIRIDETFQTGRLLRYVDASQTGGGDVSSPSVIGQGGWQQFKFLFGGGNNIYAVDGPGRLLRYVDASQTGGGDVSSPAVIGQGGWQQFIAPPTPAVP